MEVQYAISNICAHIIAFFFINAEYIIPCTYTLVIYIYDISRSIRKDRILFFRFVYAPNVFHDY